MQDNTEQPKSNEVLQTEFNLVGGPLDSALIELPYDTTLYRFPDGTFYVRWRDASELRFAGRMGGLS